MATTITAQNVVDLITRDINAHQQIRETCPSVAGNLDLTELALAVKNTSHRLYQKLYNDLKTEYEILLGRYEMVRMQYVRLRTKTMTQVTNRPDFVAGMTHPEDPNTRCISDLSGLKRTKEAMKRQKAESSTDESDDSEDLRGLDLPEIRHASKTSKKTRKA